MTSIYLFDLDGTLALIEQRRHLVENGAKKWDEFYAACVDDQPNGPVIAIARMLAEKHLVHILSGRSKAVEPQTLAWLNRPGVPYVTLKMREVGDFTPDEQLKRNWLGMFNRTKIAGVFDDRDKVCKMWREEGLTCFQVAPGAF